MTKKQPECDHAWAYPASDPNATTRRCIRCEAVQNVTTYEDVEGPDGGYGTLSVWKNI